MYKEQSIFATSKITIEESRLRTYLSGGNIFPLTIELDLTQKCTRSCPSCPYLVSRRSKHTLGYPMIDRLFGILGKNTPGVVLSGGEPTSHPQFPGVIKLAKKKGFREVAVISNGGFTHQPAIQDALLEYASSIRFSLYDWQVTEEKYFTETLEKISALRTRIEQEGSPLRIGAAMLTRKEVAHRIKPVGLKAIDSGIHWLYFHPFCVDWDTPYPKQAGQEGVLDAIAGLKESAPAGANIQVPVERYSPEPLFFEKLHGSHFLIQVGADGINYAGPECKYEEGTALLDLNEHLTDDFLWHPDRLRKINHLNSDNYTYIATKHRPPMFSDYIQKLNGLRNEQLSDMIRDPEEFINPSIV